MVPICGVISTENSSSSCSHSGGVFQPATPAGVPVRINVPGSNVVERDKWLMILGTEKKRSLEEHKTVSLVQNASEPRNILSHTILQNFVLVLNPPDPQLRWVRNQRCRHQTWTRRARAVETLAETPLARLQLCISVTDVVARRVSQNVV